jgi:2-keto-4-pentenoate hydratase
MSVIAAADRLFAAFHRVEATDPVRGDLGGVAEAYAVQELVMSAREAAGSARIGRKVGLTNPAVQRQLGVDQPDFGVLLADMDASSAAEIDPSMLVAPRIEAEIAFIMAEDVRFPTREAVLAAVASVAPAFEIVDSRVRDWDISIVDTIADNASSGLFVLGADRLSLDEVDPVGVTMSMTEDDVVVSEGTGAACLGDPVNALVWVAETAAGLGRPLLAGEVVLSGALGPMVPLRPGSRYHASIQGLGTVSVRVGGK